MAKKDMDIIVQPELMRDFQEVYGLIQSHRKRVAVAVDNEGLMMLWEVGGYVSLKLKSSAWGDGVVSQLSEYIRTQDPASRGWSYRTIYKMVQMYEMYSRPEFGALLSRMQMEGFARPQISTSGGSEIVPIEMAQMPGDRIVPIELAQIPSVLLAADKTSKREVGGLLLAHRLTRCTNLLLLTDHEAEDIEKDGVRILVRPVHEWTCGMGEA